MNSERNETEIPLQEVNHYHEGDGKCDNQFNGVCTEQSLKVPDDHDIEELSSPLTYGVNTKPPWHVTLLYSVQILMSMISGPMSVVYLLHSNLCQEGDNLVYAQMLSTAICVCGLCTFIQSTFGIRLPVFQGSSHVYIPPVVAMISTIDLSDLDDLPSTDGIYNVSDALLNTTTSQDPAWMIRFQLVKGQVGSQNCTEKADHLRDKNEAKQVSGSLIAASTIQLIIGITGIMGFLMTYIGPLTIIPCVTLIGLSMIKIVLRAVAYQWGIALLSIGLMVVFSLFMKNLSVPLPSYSRNGGCTTIRYPIFRLYPQIFAILLAWLLCYILTVSDVFSSDPDDPSYKARTDVKLDTLSRASWFFFPYPGRWGWPKFHTGLFVGLLGATISSIIESIGDYYVTAGVCQVPPPPKHAVNRGIAMEGLGSIISGFVGASHATTTYSGVIGYINLTGMGSRFVFQMTSIVTILCGIFGKFGAAMAIVPDPILGGLNTLGLGMVVSVGLSNIHHIDMASSRNHVILALAFMLGLMVPRYIEDNPGIIETGNTVFDQVVTAFLSTAMFVGGIIGFVLDNVIPGTAKERGLLSFNTDSNSHSTIESAKQCDVYNLPFLDRFCKHPIFSYIPCLPGYVERDAKRCRHSRHSSGMS